MPNFVQMQEKGLMLPWSPIHLNLNPWNSSEKGQGFYCYEVKQLERHMPEWDRAERSSSSHNKHSWSCQHTPMGWCGGCLGPEKSSRLEISPFFALCLWSASPGWCHSFRCWSKKHWTLEAPPFRFLRHGGWSPWWGNAAGSQFLSLFTTSPIGTL